MQLNQLDSMLSLQLQDLDTMGAYSYALLNGLGWPLQDCAHVLARPHTCTF